MKTLTLLRHAKSGWDDPVARDFDRPLSARGRAAAATMGRHLRGEGITFDHIAASPAVRVVETLDAAGLGEPQAWDRRLYLASASTLLDIARETPDEAARLLLVGHNPGLEDLLLWLVPPAAGDLRGAAEEKYPTATLAELAFDVEDWAGLAPGEAQLTRFIRPRDLDPALGPED